MEVSYWSAMVLANSSFKFCRSVVKSLSLSSKFSNSCSTYIFLLRGVMLQLFPGVPERWGISARMNTRTFWASFIETGHHRPYLESLRMPLLSCYSFEIFRQSKYNAGLLNKWMWEQTSALENYRILRQCKHLWWLKAIFPVLSKTWILIGHFNHSVLVDATAVQACHLKTVQELVYTLILLSCHNRFPQQHSWKVLETVFSHLTLCHRWCMLYRLTGLDFCKFIFRDSSRFPCSFSDWYYQLIT